MLSTGCFHSVRAFIYGFFLEKKYVFCTKHGHVSIEWQAINSPLSSSVIMDCDVPCENSEQTRKAKCPLKSNVFFFFFSTKQ